MATVSWTHGYQSWYEWLLHVDKWLLSLDGWLLNRGHMATTVGYIPTYPWTDGYFLRQCPQNVTNPQQDTDIYATILHDHTYYNTHTHMSVHILNSNLSTKLGICHISFCRDITIKSQKSPTTQDHVAGD